MSSIGTSAGKMALYATVVALGLGSMVSAQAAPKQANAGASQASTSGSTGNTQAQEMMKFSANGHAALDAIVAARVAMFEGHPKASIDLMVKAEQAMAAAEREAPDFKMETSHTRVGSAANQGATYVPVDARMSMAEDYVRTPEKQGHIDNANKNMKSGDTQGAIRELKLAGIDVNYTLVLMPIASSENHLQMALTLADAGKYYESTVALKAIEDGLIADTESMLALPASAPAAGN